MIVFYFGRRKTNSKIGAISNVDKIKDILKSLKRRVENPEHKSEITFCLRMLTSEEPQSPSDNNIPNENMKKVENKQDSLSWARNNSLKMNSARGLLEKRRNFKDRLSNSKIMKEIGINSKVKDILRDVDQLSFDIFALSRETSGNEMVV
mmetsp:Transcript_11657/g.11591  ORF Transcript_11657/g.11591 Transcript_11657/m.11591 type:complete len:150 (+) Transcript_11657:792-1241(+)